MTIIARNKRSRNNETSSDGNACRPGVERSRAADVPPNVENGRTLESVYDTYSVRNNLSVRTKKSTWGGPTPSAPESRSPPWQRGPQSDQSG